MTTQYLLLDFIPPSVNHAYNMRVIGRRVIRFPTKEAKNFKEQVRIAAGMYGITKFPKECMLEVWVDFYLPDRRKHDVDNLLKMTFDGLNGVMFDDDGQVLIVHARKLYQKKKAQTTIAVDLIRKVEEV